MAGIPTMVITRVGFSQVVANAYAGLGFSPTEAPTMYEFPLDMFIPGSNLSPLAENFDKIVAGLTTWTPKAVSYTHLRAHETRHDLVCRLLLEKKKKKK